MSIKLSAILVFCGLWAIIRLSIGFANEFHSDFVLNDVPVPIEALIFIIHKTLLPAFWGLILFLAFC